MSQHNSDQDSVKMSLPESNNMSANPRPIAAQMDGYAARYWTAALDMRPALPKCPSCFQQADEKEPLPLRRDELGNLENCPCPICNRIWEKLFPHPLPDRDRNMSGNDPWTNMRNQSKSEYRQVWALFTSRIDQLQNSHLDEEGYAPLTEADHTALAQLPTALNDAGNILPQIKVQSKDPTKTYTGELLSLERLANITKQLFYGTALDAVKYRWELPCHDARCQVNSRKDGRCGHLDPLACGDISFPPGFTLVRINIQVFVNRAAYSVEDAVLMLLGTLLHQQLHVYCNRVVCNGQCTGTGRRKATKQQQDLCKYLYQRMFEPFQRVTYNGHVVQASFCGHQHGPAFQAMLHKVRDTTIVLLARMQDKLKQGFTLERIAAICFTENVIPCHCKDSNGCILHCFPDDYEQLAFVAPIVLGGLKLGHKALSQSEWSLGLLERLKGIDAVRARRRQANYKPNPATLKAGEVYEKQTGMLSLNISATKVLGRPGRLEYYSAVLGKHTVLSLTCKCTESKGKDDTNRWHSSDDDGEVSIVFAKKPF